MKTIKHISALYALMALVATLILTPAANAAASHACCPPGVTDPVAMKHHMASMGHDMALMNHDMDGVSKQAVHTGTSAENDNATVWACDFSCCGVMVNTALSVDGSAVFSSSLIAGERHFLFGASFVSITTVVQAPPPKNI